MFYINEEIFFDYKDVEFDILNSFINYPLAQQKIRYQNQKIINYDYHYFELMSLMRIQRMMIPEKFNSSYFSEKIHNLIEKYYDKFNSYSIDIKIVCSEVITNKKLFPKINSLIKIEQVTNLSYSDNFYEVDIYRERCISNNHFTFISGRNEIINSSKVFSYENNFNDVFLIDYEKKVVRSSKGSIFLIYGNKVITPLNHFRDLNSTIIERLFEKLDKNFGYEFSQEPISLFDILKANEIFIFNLIDGIYSVKSYKKRKFEVSETQKIYNLIINSVLDL
tara:strand:+ start:471 stop:1307 length:837 start_codon:yes stop_codon:yes gene_type:complete